MQVMHVCQVLQTQSRFLKASLLHIQLIFIPNKFYFDGNVKDQEIQLVVKYICYYSFCHSLWCISRIIINICATLSAFLNFSFLKQAYILPAKACYEWNSQNAQAYCQSKSLLSLKMFSNKNSCVHSPLSRFTQEGIFQGIYSEDIYHINVIEMAKLYLTDYIGL